MNRASQSLGNFDLVADEEFQQTQSPEYEEAQSSNCYRAFQKFYSKELETIQQSVQESEVDEQYLILNRDTGTFIDVRSLDQDSPIKFDVDKAWKNYWNQSNILNEQLLSAVQRNDIIDVQNILEILKNSYYIDVNTKDLDEWTPLHFACNQNQSEMVISLLKYGADVNRKTSQQRTPIHFAAVRNNVTIGKLLIAYGADARSPDIEGNTPLHFAAQFGAVDFCEMLLKMNIDPLLKNNIQLTPVQLASDGRIVELFQQYGVDLNQFDYCRTMIKDTNVLLQNGRQDHVRKLLQMTKQESQAQHKKSHELAVEDIVEDSQIQNQPLERRSTWGKLLNYALRFTQIIIQKKDPVEEDIDRLGPNSFIYYQKLGEGGFGKVYLVEKKNAQIKKYYAMKVIKKEDMESSNMIKSAQVEKDVLQIMAHPFIVKLNFAFQTNTHLYLVMDLCPGGDLSTHLELKQRLPENIVKIYAAEITLALEALHHQGIIFRDLKPENVVLDGDGHAMLTDFGLSKQGVDEDVKNNSFCGTLAYLAPEVLMRKGHGRQVDWYMLGVFIYELLVGLPPYFDEEKEIVKENIRKGSFKIPKYISRDAKDIIVKLLTRNPQKRLGSSNDAKEVKDHEWFSDINWEECIQRKLKPPKPPILFEPKEPMKINMENDNRKNKIQGWTFIDES